MMHPYETLNCNGVGPQSIYNDPTIETNEIDAK